MAKYGPESIYQSADDGGIVRNINSISKWRN